MTFARADAPRLLSNLIDGQLVGIPDAERRNPADDREVVSLHVRSSPSDVEDAVAAGCAAAPAWSLRSEPDRGAILMRTAAIVEQRGEEIARLITREEGKTLGESRAEVARAADYLRFFGALGWREVGDVLPAQDSRTWLHTRREPIGVAAIVTPWNFPLAIPVWKSAPALVAGVCVVCKPAPFAPAAVNLYAECLAQAGLPIGVFNIVHGAGPDVGAALVAHDSVDAVSFTGSTAVGNLIRRSAGERGARVQLELGGNNALVVLDDADPGRAAQLAVRGAFGLTGQACTSTRRLICTPGSHDAVRTAVIAAMGRFDPANGLSDGAVMGPVVHRDQLDSNLRFIDGARCDGAIVEAGGSAVGLMMEPVLLSRVDPQMVIAQDEIFGPVLSIIEVRDLDEAIDVVNDTPFGLAAGLVTDSLSSAQRFAEEVRVGTIKINATTTGNDVNAPFGGTKASSNDLFKEQGRDATNFFTRQKTVYLAR
jgi:NAD-dependent aldehyde dehydrogenases